MRLLARSPGVELCIFMLHRGKLSKVGGGGKSGVCQ